MNSTRRASRAAWAGLGFCCLSVLLTGESLIADTPGAAVTGEKDKKDTKKKFEPPKLPKGCGNPQWDLSDLEARFLVLKGGVNDNGLVYFLLELKEDAQILPMQKVRFIDQDGVEVGKTSAAFNPSTAKKGQKVRLVFNSSVNGELNQAVWRKAAKVKIGE